ncbi:hypothetical protein, partial [Streptomyces diastaticus]|uniref:hypothetical protein n=1 Tax=Streptomyces diastaticus TaxID=1956 RepID=UPI00344E9FBC
MDSPQDPTPRAAWQRPTPLSSPWRGKPKRLHDCPETQQSPGGGWIRRAVSTHHPGNKKVVVPGPKSGWITDERPHPDKMRLAEEGFH